MKLRRLMLTAIAVVCAIAAQGPAANAAIIFSDDFSGVAGPLAGTPAEVGGNWAATAAAATPIQLDGSGAALVGTSGQDEFNPFSSVASTSLGFIATDIDLTVTAAQANSDYFAHLSSPAGTTSNFYQRLFARSVAGGGYQLGLAGTSGGTTTFGTTTLALGTQYDVDITWTFVPGVLNDTFVLTVDSLPYLLHTWNSAAAEPATLAAANLRQGTAANAPTVSVTSFTVDLRAVPEPSSAILAVFGGLLGLMQRRNR